MNENEDKQCAECFLVGKDKCRFHKQNQAPSSEGRLDEKEVELVRLKITNILDKYGFNYPVTMELLQIVKDEIVKFHYVTEKEILLIMQNQRRPENGNDRIEKLQAKAICSHFAVPLKLSIGYEAIEQKLSQALEHIEYLRACIKDKDEQIKLSVPPKEVPSVEELRAWIKKSDHQNGCSWSRTTPMYKKCSCGKLKLGG